LLAFPEGENRKFWDGRRVLLVCFIDALGSEFSRELEKRCSKFLLEKPYRWFYKKKITYFDEDGLVYWTMGAPIEETTIINRCTKENTYEYRLKMGTLP